MEIKKLNLYLFNKVSDFFKAGILIALVVLTVQESRTIAKVFPIPCRIEVASKVDKDKVAVERSLTYLGYATTSNDIVDGMVVGAKRLREYKVSSRVIKNPPLLVTALAHSESGMKLSAVSSKGYSGILQTPGRQTTKKYADVDVLHGCRILEEKLEDPQSKGDLRTALAMYKGGLNKQAFKQADEVLALYSKLKSIPV